MTVLARSIGIPARVVNGFAGGSENRLGGFIEYAHSDAHTWVEVHFDQSGWVRYDPTPPDLRLAGADALRESGGMRSVLSAMELWWFRNVVDFDRSTQAHAIRSIWQRWKALRGSPSGLVEPSLPGTDSGPGFQIDQRLPWILAALAALGVGGFALRGRRRERLALPEYQTALRLLARRGLRRGVAEPARGFAARVAEQRPAANGAFGRLTQAYLAARFGGHAAPDMSRELEALRSILRHRQPTPPPV